MPRVIRARGPSAEIAIVVEDEIVVPLVISTFEGPLQDASVQLEDITVPPTVPRL